MTLDGPACLELEEVRVLTLVDGQQVLVNVDQVDLDNRGLLEQQVGRGGSDDALTLAGRHLEELLLAIHDLPGSEHADGELDVAELVVQRRLDQALQHQATVDEGIERGVGSQGVPLRCFELLVQELSTRVDINQIRRRSEVSQESQPLGAVAAGELGRSLIPLRFVHACQLAIDVQQVVKGHARATSCMPQLPKAGLSLIKVPTVHSAYEAGNVLLFQAH